MKKLLFALLFISVALPAFATTYTVSCPSLTMHVGDIVPPNIVQVQNGTTVVAATSAIFSAPPTCSNSVTSSSAVGSYTITAAAGTLVSGSDTQTLVNGTMRVIAADPYGASLTASVTYPPNFQNAAQYGIINAKNNPIMNCAGDGTTDDTDCVQYLFAFSRGGFNSQVTCNGTTTLTNVSGTPFTGITSGPIEIAGVINQIVSVQSSTSLTLSTACPTQSNVIARLPRGFASVSGTTVTWISGPQYSALKCGSGTSGSLFQIGTSFERCGTLVSPTQFTLLAAPAANLSSFPLYNADLLNSNTAGFLPFFIYFPASTYLVSNSIFPYGAYWSMWGDGPYKSIMRWAPNSAAFQTTSTQAFSPLSVNGNDSFQEFVHNMGFDMGYGNPNAVIVAWQPSNFGALRNVAIWSEDSACLTALAVDRNAVGPGMGRNLSIYGCQYGINGGNVTYNYTFENVTVEGQTKYGISNQNLKMQVRHLLSDEPSGTLNFYNNLGNSSAVLMDSELFNEGGATCIQNSQNAGQASTLYLKNITASGCTTTVNDYGSGSLVSSGAGNISEQWTGTAQSLFNSASAAHSIGLAYPETPQASDPSPITWCQLGTDITTWQATLNACSSTTAYMAPGLIGTTNSGNIGLTVPASINHLQFFNAANPTGNTYVVQLTIADNGTTPLVIEGPPQNQTTIKHNGTRPVVLLDANTWSYDIGSTPGNLYGDDVILGGNDNTNGSIYFGNGQNIWIRASNQEQNPQNKLVCTGCNLWLFGFKTEHNGNSINMTSGQAEVYGFSALGDDGNNGSGGTMFNLTNSNFFATGSVIVQGGSPGNGFTNWVTETQGANTASLAEPGSLIANENLNMYYSYGLSGTGTPTAASVTFSPASETFTGTLSVSLACATASSTINYTLDGSTPTTSSSVYSSALPLTATTTVTAICSASGYTTSSPSAATYTYSSTLVAATPTFSPAGGPYTGNLSVSITSATSGAAIYFTTDGTTPTNGSSLYSAPVSVANSETIKAIAILSGYTTSSVGTAIYTINSAVSAASWQRQGNVKRQGNVRTQ